MMRTPIGLVPVLMLTAVTSVRAQQLTMDDPHYKELSSLGSNIGLYQDADTNAWMLANGDYADINGARCMRTLAQLATAGVPDSRTIPVAYDAPDFKKGVHSLAEIRKACALVEHLGKMKVFEFWAKQTKEEADVRGAERFKDPTYKHCLDSYDAMIKAGIAPTDRVPEQKLRVGTWSGTVLEIRQRWCDKPR